MLESDLSFWRAQSGVTQPGAAAGALDLLPHDLDALTKISSRLVFHYRADGEWEENGIATDRAQEINLCYAADMFDRLLEFEPSLTGPRPPAKRILGCCRDFSTLFTSILRHQGVPARCRIGFATYFIPGWWLDHVIVELWDNGRWRMVDPELMPGFRAGDGRDLNRLDLSPADFLTAPQAWLAARDGRIDPDRVVVAPDLDVPATRSWPQLAHNLVHDMAALSRVELLLWHDWGASLVEDVLADEVVEVLDRAATAVAETNVPLSVIEESSAHELLRVTDTVSQVDPVSLVFASIDVRRALAGV